jgi:hypothetical protein
VLQTQPEKDQVHIRKLFHKQSALNAEALNENVLTKYL